MDDKRQSIYNQVSQHVDVGTFDDFNKAMDDPGRRQKFFKGVSAHVDLGDSNKFYNAVSPQSKIVTDTSKNPSNVSKLSPQDFIKGNAARNERLQKLNLQRDEGESPIDARLNAFETLPKIPFLRQIPKAIENTQGGIETLINAGKEVGQGKFADAGSDLITGGLQTAIGVGSAVSPTTALTLEGFDLANDALPQSAQKIINQPITALSEKLSGHPINPNMDKPTKAADQLAQLIGFIGLHKLGGNLTGTAKGIYNDFKNGNVEFNEPPKVNPTNIETQSSPVTAQKPDIQPESKGNVQPIETKPTDTQPVKVSADPQSRLIVNDLEKYVNGAIKRKSQINEASITNRIDDIRDPVEQKRLGELYNKVLEHNKNLKSGKPIENTENQQAGQTLPVNNPEILPEPKLQPQEIAKNKTNRIIQELLDKEKNQGNQEGQKIVSTAVQTPKDIKAENNFKAHDELDKNATEDQKGFIDNKGNFLNREEAAKIAEDAGQVDKSVKELHSQDLRDGAKNAQTEPIDEVKKGQDNTKTDLTKEAIQKVGGNENFQKGAQEYINQNKNRKSLPEDENLANAYLVEEYRNRVVNEDPKVMDLHKDIPLNPENENQGNPLKQGSNITPEKPVNVEEKQPKPVEDHLIESPRSELPKPISDKILDKTQSMISEIKDAKVENQKAYVSDFEGKKTGNSYINNFPKWFSDLGKSKSEIIKGLQKIIDDQGKDKGKLVEDLKSVILDKLKGEYEESMLTGSAGKFSRENLGKEPADSEILDFINNTKDNLTSESTT